MYYKYDSDSNVWYRGAEIRLPNSAVLKEGVPASEDGWNWHETPPNDYVQWKELQDNTLAENTLRIHQLSPNFNLKVDSVSNLAYEKDKVYNEFNGLKETTEYVDANLNIVAVKVFTIYQQGSLKGTKLRIDFYDVEGNVSDSIETIDYYTELQIRKHKTKCVLRVFERLLWDVEQELMQLQYLIDHSDEATKTAMLPVLGVSTIKELEAMPGYVQGLFDDLMKVHLKDQVDLMYKTGDTTELYNAIDTLVYPFLDQQALTSDQEVKFTYRQILQAKFNPSNFDFYA